MNTEKAQKENNRVCPHNYIRNGYYLGLQIDVYYCTECGESRVAVQWENLKCATLHRMDC
jgi:ferredoxin-like protein FixX